MDSDFDHPSYHFNWKVSGSMFLLLCFGKTGSVDFSLWYKVYPNTYQAVADYTLIFIYYMADLKE